MLTRPSIADRLERASSAPLEVPRLAGDQGVEGSITPVPAAVLICLVERPDGPGLLLTQRTTHLRDHPGQISLPGGRAEDTDTSLRATALREAQEEIGLSPDQVEILGDLANYDTVTGYRIHPVVGWLRQPFMPRIDPYEVDEVFELPLSWVIDPKNHQRRSFRRGAMTRTYYVLPYRNRFIWGATAGILINFSALLKA